MHQLKPRKSRTFGRVAFRLLGRVGGVGFVASAIAYSAVLGGHVDLDAGNRLETLSGDLAGYFGYAAQEIRISGLEWQSPPAVLAAVGVTPGGPLFGFQPVAARRALEGLDWVESARVQRLFPNQLEISVVERQPFAIWQRGGMFHVIDETGVTLTGIDPAAVPGLPVVTGAGAETAVAQLVNHLEAHPELRSKVKAAGRVGLRRWNLYFDGAVKALLPEHGLEKALAVLSALDDRHGIFDRRVEAIDLRVAGSVVFSPPPVQDPELAPVNVAGVSQR
ncbi:MAG TPA: cell division protein FtsQ/DivIB [Aestuariivirgaceae bacterium]|nr:cell division protein FtsQ/DivIB [Aestuariivirgaceae bacterium]